MSNLVLELKPGEAMLINGAAIRFRTKARLELTSRARFLFGKQIIDENDASTPAQRLYHALQTAYVGADADREDAMTHAIGLLDHARDQATCPADAVILDAIHEAATSSGGCYAALKLVRRLIVAEMAGTVRPTTASP